jgi:hypothetical protein
MGAPLPPGDYMTLDTARAMVGAVVSDPDFPPLVGRVTGCLVFSFPDPANPSQRQTVWGASLLLVNSKRPEQSPEHGHYIGADLHTRWRVLEGAQRKAALEVIDAHHTRFQQELKQAPTIKPRRRP